MLLISRTPRRVTPQTPWIRSLVAAVEQSRLAGESLVLGRHRLAWDLALWLARRPDPRRLPMPCLILLENPGEFGCLPEGLSLPSDIGLSAQRLRPATSASGTFTSSVFANLPSPSDLVFAWPAGEAGGEFRNVRPSLRPPFAADRDAAMAELADAAWHLYVRQNGTMSRLCRRLSDCKKTVKTPNHATRRVVVTDTVSDSSDPIQPCASWSNPSHCGIAPCPAEVQKGHPRGGYLIHWTRGVQGPWPGEKPERFWQWLAEGSGKRSGWETLGRILEERLLRASPFLIASGMSVICLTEAEPRRFFPLPGDPATSSATDRPVQWRASLGRWTFEPYGLALVRKELEELEGGLLRPVIYINPKDQPPLETMSDAWQYQKIGHFDARREKEWRWRGDLDLTRLNGFALRAITATAAEAREIFGRFGLRSWYLNPPEGGSVCP